MSPVESIASDSLDLPAAGETFAGKYRIGASIGIGGMATVFEAHHLDLDQKVAIKFLLPELCHDAEIVERFLREGRAAIKIRSEHVVRVHDVGVLDGRPYLVMEYLDGQDLDQLLAERGALPVATAVDYLLQACEAIAEAHALDIIHRDLKPANLFLTHRADGTACVKVLDFGISKMHTGARSASGVTPRATLATTVMGSPHYMSPEQMESSTQVDARADIWSLGTILYELLANQQAFEGWSITEVCARVMRSHPAPLSARRSDVPVALQRIIDRCLQKDAAARFSSVAELARALAPFGSTSAFASACTISRVLEGSHSFEGSVDGLAVTAVSLRPQVRLRAHDILNAPPRRRGHPFRGTVAMSVLAFAAAGFTFPATTHRAFTSLRGTLLSYTAATYGPVPVTPPAPPPPVVTPPEPAPAPVPPASPTLTPEAPPPPAPVVTPPPPAPKPPLPPPHHSSHRSHLHRAARVQDPALAGAPDVTPLPADDANPYDALGEADAGTI